ncbi:hypothetical protein LAZ40_06830 [Cereibacter sphaeroides]|uniref:hypothetical protein n=1 Tax=Cereibacter sphaeroides TaxID=1063 RepID=UPI001F248938|nr:hypothetical protein [Cereibacter sphaeroides]MCE6958761.1 hypothetical protein [Cereibacter sphaeroides]MCE6973365.1 hypothetical protein [Cereibacter sphaeroides]
MTWQNLGDISPRSGTFLVRNPELDPEGDFRAEGVQTVPERQVGGSDDVFLLRQGTIFLARRNFASALEAVGATLEGDRIRRPGQDGEDQVFPLQSVEGLRELCHAAFAYGGIEDPEIASLVRIGFPDPAEPSPKFDGEITVYPEKTSLWAVMRLELDGFDHAPEAEPKAALPYDTEDGPYAGLPREIRTRADLMRIGAFRDLGSDSCGNPIVWKNHYEHRDCDGYSEHEDDPPAPTWTSDWSCQCDDACPECSVSISPGESVWLGPKERDLIALWESLEDAPGRTVEPDETPAP